MINNTAMVKLGWVSQMEGLGKLSLAEITEVILKGKKGLVQRTGYFGKGNDVDIQGGKTSVKLVIFTHVHFTDYMKILRVFTHFPCSYLIDDGVNNGNGQITSDKLQY